MTETLLSASVSLWFIAVWCCFLGLFGFFFALIAYLSTQKPVCFDAQKKLSHVFSTRPPVCSHDLTCFLRFWPSTLIAGSVLD